MARQTQIVVTDDLDGSAADSTVRFSYQGASFEIDLNKKNAGMFARAIEPYIEAGRKVRTGPGRASRTAPGTSKPNPAEVRAWARDQGVEVSDRGRVPAELVVRFQAANV
jgi:Lsr2